MKKFLPVSFAWVALFAPLSALAVGGVGTLDEVVRTLGSFVGAAVPVIAALALLAFFWGLAMYLFNFGEGKEDVQKKGRNLMIYGILAIFVMVSVFGIAQLLQRSFGIQPIQQINAPTIPTGNQFFNR